MKIKAVLFTCSLLLYLVPGIAFAEAQQEQPFGDRIVAVVNAQVITQSELEQQVDIARKALHAQGNPLPDPKVLRAQVLQHAVLERLQLDLVERAKITVSQQTIDEAIAAIAKRNHATVADLIHSVRASGMREQDYRTQLQTQIQLGQLQERMVGQGVGVSEREIAQWIRKKTEDRAQFQYRVQDTWVPLSEKPAAREQARAQSDAEQLYVYLRRKQAKPPTLTVLRQQIGGRPVRAQPLGWRALEALPTVFAQPIAAASTPGVLKPILAPNGFHVLQLLEKKRVQEKPVTRLQAREVLYRIKFEKALKQWLDTLRQHAYVRILL